MDSYSAESTQTLCRRCGVILLHDDGPCAACSAEPREWTELDWVGPYRVQRALGSGPSGRTYLCDDDTGNSRLVVKLFRWHADPATAERCVRESRMVGRIEHPNLVRIRAIGRARGEAISGTLPRVIQLNGAVSVTAAVVRPAMASFSGLPALRA